MGCPPQIAWRVVDWDSRFETRGSLRQRGPRGNIAIPTELRDAELRLLRSGGHIAFAVWSLICRIAATCSRRGVLLQNGLPMSDAELARLTFFPLNLVQPALQMLESPEIGLIERVPLQMAMDPPELPTPLPRQAKTQPLLQCPVCKTDLTVFYHLENQYKNATAIITRVPTEEWLTGTVGSANQCDRSGTEANFQSSATEQVTSNSLRSHPFEEPVAPTMAPASPVQRRDSDEDELRAAVARLNEFNLREPIRDPAPTGLDAEFAKRRREEKPGWIYEATAAEFEDMHIRYFRHEITRAELDQFLETHYYDEDNPENDDWENDDWDNEDEEFKTDLPPPK